MISLQPYGNKKRNKIRALTVPAVQFSTLAAKKSTARLQRDKAKPNLKLVCGATVQPEVH